MAKINPKTVDNIFTDDVLDVLPANDQIKRGAAIKKRYDAMTEEEIEKKNQSISRSRKGQTSNHKGLARPWRGQKRINKSVEQHTEETKAKISASKKGIPAWNKGLTGHVAWNKGQAMTDETKNKIRQSKNAQACKTPFGLFQYFADFVLHCQTKNLFPNRNSYLKTFLRNQFTKRIEGYEYISQEEYSILTGHNPQERFNA